MHWNIISCHFVRPQKQSPQISLLSIAATNEYTSVHLSKENQLHRETADHLKCGFHTYITERRHILCPENKHIKPLNSQKERLSVPQQPFQLLACALLSMWQRYFRFQNDIQCGRSETTLKIWVYLYICIYIGQFWLFLSSCLRLSKFVVLTVNHSQINKKA